MSSSSTSSTPDLSSGLEAVSGTLRGVVRDVEARASAWKHEAGARMQWRRGFAVAEQPLPVYHEGMEPIIAIAFVELASVVLG